MKKIKVENIGKKLREYRIAKKLTLVELAEISGISKSAISQYESGDKEPGFYKIISILNALEVNINELIEYE